MAGGLGSRLGGTKAVVPLVDRPLITYPLAAFEAAGIESVIVAKPGSELPTKTVATLEEPTEPRHPLCGIVTALEHAAERGTGAVIVLACDMPLVPSELLTWIAGLDDRLCVPLVDGHPQPLAARYSVSLLPELSEALRRRPGPLTGIVTDLKPRFLGEDELARFGDPSEMLHNVNTTSDLRRADHLLRQGMAL